MSLLSRIIDMGMPMRRCYGDQTKNAGRKAAVTISIAGYARARLSSEGQSLCDSALIAIVAKLRLSVKMVT
jgi:hypothetical protein